jgi:folate-binding protein YgfZ
MTAMAIPCCSLSTKKAAALATLVNVLVSTESLGSLLSDLSSDYTALTSSGGASWLRREVVRAHGADVVTYLQGQLTQDIEPIDIGESRWSFVLQPHGKVDGFLRLTRVAQDEFLIDCDRGQTETLIERLERFKMRTKVEFESTSFKVLAVRGVDLPTPTQKDVTVATVSWKGMTGYDLIGENPSVPDGIVEVDDEAYEALRITVGFPLFGAELDQLTIPAEAGANDLAISFNKGCYTGQELVARIDSRGGNVPRHLRAIVFECDEHIPRGATIVPKSGGSNAKPLGVLTSVAFSPKLEKYVGLALIRRDALPPVEAVIEWDDGPTSCRIEQLPLEP